MILMCYFQCGEPTALNDIVAKNLTSIVAILTGNCHLASVEDAAPISTASLHTVYSSLIKVEPQRRESCIHDLYKLVTWLL